jgi:hypothetical protein
VERWERVCVFAITTVIMAVIAVWLAWVMDTERWHLLALYLLVLSVIIWRYWDYRG